MFATASQLDATLILFVLCVAIIDSHTHRIPNLLCATAAIIGFCSQVWIHGEAGLLSALGGAAVGFAMFLPFYVLRAFGAGDVKAMATVGIFLGMRTTMIAVGITLIAGGILGLAVLVLRPAHANATLHRLIGLLVCPIASMRSSRETAIANSRQRFPYGVAIACGTVASLLMMPH
jgi:prepilin peptidase CpaA